MVAALVSLLLARLSGLPGFYWAPITTLIVLQSTRVASYPVAARVVAGAALAGGLGAVLTRFLGSSFQVFGAGILALGLICAAGGGILTRSTTPVDPVFYRFSAIALAIVMLVVWHEPVWTVALDRFLEVALGAAVALAMAVVWPLDQRQMLVKST